MCLIANRTMVAFGLMAMWANGYATECNVTEVLKFQHAEIGQISVFQEQTTKAILFESIMQVNPDGAPDAYHPDDIGTVFLCNGLKVGRTCNQVGGWKAECMAGYRQAKAEGFSGKTPICFFAMATDPKDGRPVIQNQDDPRPGYFVSTTSLHQPGGDVLRPSGQVDSNEVPFAVIPGSWQGVGAFAGPKLGDYGVAYRKSNGKFASFVVADTGPASKLGEGSVALVKALGHDPFVTRYGKRRAFSGIGGRDVVYVIFPGTANPLDRLNPENIEKRARELLLKMGGEDGVRGCESQLQLH